MCLSVLKYISIRKLCSCNSVRSLSTLAFSLFHFHKACVRIKGHLKVLKNKQLMPFCQAESNQGNLSHMLYSVSSLKCQP